MSKYNRQHGSANMSKGIHWILIAGVAALGIYKIVHLFQTVNTVHEFEMKEKKYNNSGHYFIITDSAGKKDTQWIQGNLENYDATADTIKKPSLKDSFK